MYDFEDFLQITHFDLLEFHDEKHRPIAKHLIDNYEA